MRKILVVLTHFRSPLLLKFNHKIGLVQVVFTKSEIEE